MMQLTSSAFVLLFLSIASCVYPAVSDHRVAPSDQTSEFGMLRANAKSRTLTAPLQLNDDDASTASLVDDTIMDTNVHFGNVNRALEDSDGAVTVVATLSVTLVDSETDQDIVTLNEGSIVDLAEVGRSLNIRASSNYSFTSMELWFDGDFVRTESVAPYSLGGDVLEDYRSFRPLTVKGFHKVEVRAKIGETVSQQLRVGFQVVDQTFAPTPAHTYFPTPSPTSFPSDWPSLAPTSGPSDRPSSAPSEWPSMVPSDSPSTVPSDSPSTVPSDSPSTVPSDSPSMVPSDSPSMVPSDIPSALPSDTPSALPSDVPSSFPSDQPSLSFFAKPSYVKEYFIDAGGDPKRPRYFQANQTQIFRNRKYRVAKTGSYSQKVFQSYRAGTTVNYTLPGLEPNAVHNLTLGFAEIYKPNCVDGVGARVMDVVVNGFPFLSEMDVLDKVPCHTAYFEHGMFAADSDGKLNIIFSSSAGEAFVSMIDIKSVAPTGK